MLQPKCRNGHDTGKSIKISNLKKNELDWQIKLLSTIPHPCKNGKYGCQEIAMLEELTLHEDICDYRKVNCVADYCKADVCYLNYMEHFEINHLYFDHIDDDDDDDDETKNTARPYSIDTIGFFFYDIESLKMNRINAFDQTFLEVNHVQNGFVYRWVVLVGFKEEAEKYCYQATIANLTNVNDKITFSGKVRSLDETRKDIIAEQKCFIVGKQTCKNLMDENEEIYYKIELRNLKEEAKDENEESGIDDDDESQSSAGVL